MTSNNQSQTVKLVRDKVFGLPVNRNTLLNNTNGTYRKKIEERQRALIVKISFIKTFLNTGEVIQFLTTACSPINLWGQILSGGLFIFFNRSLLVFTNQRVFHVPTTRKYGYRNCVAQIRYDDIEKIEAKGHCLAITYKNSTQETFLCLARKERKKIKRFIDTIVTRAKTKSKKDRTYLCPQCTHPVTPKTHRCATCGLAFKSARESGRRAILLPGGGYFYTHHPVLGTGAAVLESSLLFVLGGLAFATLNGIAVNPVLLVIAGAVLMSLKILSIFHAKRFTLDLIPQQSP